MKYLKLAYYNSKELFYYGYTLIFRNVWLLLLIFLITSIVTYGAVAKGSVEIGGISLGVYVWYVFVTELLMTNRRDEDIIKSVKSGDIVIFLNKPVNYAFYLLSNSFLKTLFKMIILGSFAALIISVIVKNFPWHGIGEFILFFISLCIGILLLALISLVIGLISFVIEDSYFIRFFISKAYFIFGGVFFPLDIYPQWMQTVSKYLPFQYYFYGPAKFFVTGDIGFFISYFPIQIVWFGILLGVVLGSYHFLVKKLEINGG